MIFKETLVTTLRFLSNFCYIAFAFNRISLIGKDHPKLVQFMSEVGTKKYIFVTFIISIGLSIVKGFRYRINYDRSELDYPYLFETRLEFDIGWTRRLYLVVNFVSDILNYVILALMNIGIDVYMVSRLRKTLNEKLNRFKSDQENAVKVKQLKSNETNKQREHAKESISSAIRMVMINSALNLFLKLPLVYVPIQNMIATIYYNDNVNPFVNIWKDENLFTFYLYMKTMKEADLITLIYEFSNWLFNFAISIQFFVYLKFDKKLKEAFDSVFRKNLVKNSKN